MNSLWFWGGGVLPEFVRTTYAVLHGDDILLRGLAELAKLPLQPLPTDFASLAKDGDALVDLRGARDPGSLASQCILPAAKVLRGERVLQLDFADGACFTIRRSQRWRFWRRAWTSLA